MTKRRCSNPGRLNNPSRGIDVAAFGYLFDKNDASSQVYLKRTSRRRLQVGALTLAAKGNPQPSPASSCQTRAKVACMPMEQRLTNSDAHEDLIKHTTLCVPPPHLVGKGSPATMPCPHPYRTSLIRLIAQHELPMQIRYASRPTAPNERRNKRGYGPPASAIERQFNEEVASRINQSTRPASGRARTPRSEIRGAAMEVWQTPPDSRWRTLEADMRCHPK